MCIITSFVYVCTGKDMLHRCWSLSHENLATVPLKMPMTLNYCSLPPKQESIWVSKFWSFWDDGYLLCLINVDQKGRLDAAVFLKIGLVRIMELSEMIKLHYIYSSLQTTQWVTNLIIKTRIFVQLSQEHLPGGLTTSFVSRNSSARLGFPALCLTLKGKSEEKGTTKTTVNKN